MSLQPKDRYIAIGGESWAAALGQDQAKYITPKVGIFLYGFDSRPMRKQVEEMAFMSANVDMAWHPLLQIMDVMEARLIEWSKNYVRHKEAASHFQAAIDAVRTAERATKQKT